MAKYETLPTTPISPDRTMLRAQQLPELVHVEDPAICVMTDFTQTPPLTIHPEDTMDDAINEMKAAGTHLLLVINEQEHFQGIVSSEDVLGEKPIQIIQEGRIRRDKVLVNMIMVSCSEITALDIAILESARVGHIVNTLSARKQHYALAVSPGVVENTHTIRGMFTTSQISKQLHMDIAHAIAEASSISELQKRHE